MYILYHLQCCQHHLRCINIAVNVYLVMYNCSVGGGEHRDSKLTW